MTRPLRIASYNIRKSVGLDWRRDPMRILDVIGEIDPDVVLLQEADKRVGARASSLPPADIEALGYDIADVSLRPLSIGWHGNAILIRRGLWTGGMGRIDIPTFEPRGAVYADITVFGMRVVGAHLALTPGMRARQITALRKATETANHPTVIAGDFNEWRQNGAVARDFGAGYRVVIPGATFHSSRPVAPLDRFVLRHCPDPIRVRVHRSDLARRASDHLPIYLDIPRQTEPTP